MRTVRQFVAEDAEGLSRLILRTLRTVNIQDYSSEAIEALAPSFTPEKLIAASKQVHMIVCLEGEDLVGTASLDGDRVRTVFVDVERQKGGIGRQLMVSLEITARGKNLDRVELYASLSAEGFYRQLGYARIERIDRKVGGFPVPVIKMAKGLAPD